MTWDFYGDHQDVYLTFDDGPTPGVTPWVLDRLDEAGAKATFFCLGRNVDKHPGLTETNSGCRTQHREPFLQPPEGLSDQREKVYG